MYLRSRFNTHFHLHAVSQSSAGPRHRLRHLKSCNLHGRYTHTKLRVKTPQRIDSPVQPAKCAQDTAVVSPTETLDLSEELTPVSGSPEPMGPSPTASGVNFAIFSANATAVSLCLFDKENTPLKELPMERTGDVWHLEVKGCPKSDVLYGLRVCGEGGWDTGHRWDPKRVLLDPYAPLISGRRQFGVRDEREQYKKGVGSVFRGTFDFSAQPFDWEGVESPGHHYKDLIIYEVPVRTFTASPTSGLPEGERGTYMGLAKKADHLVELGITAVELLPVFEYDEFEFQRDKNPRDHMINVWGYSHITFMAPMSRFGSNAAGPAAAAREFKEMVKMLHSKGIEVILDVVYNHTAEGSDVNPYILSHRCIDCNSYYQMKLDQYEQLLNYSGCGNSVNANNPAMAQQIIDSLRMWVQEYHVDGFRFDLATCLCRDSRGELMQSPPLIRAIAKDPVLSKTKLIAEPWDIGGYQVGSFPNWDVWAEWNGIFRDTLRRFFRGDPGLKKDLATRLSGSADLYHKNNRKPYHSVNFVTAHDGFSLRDLVSYNSKHNEANGEQGRDGTNDNLSWNCGVEGVTDDVSIIALRWKQMKNFHLALMVAQGTPMVLSGDEYGHSRGGNNNWYGHDNDMTHFKWEADEEEDAFKRFYAEACHFRRQCPLLGREEFLTPEDITWHEGDWENDASKFIAFTLHGRKLADYDLYCAFNSHRGNVPVMLPPAPAGQHWCRLADTNLPAPRDWVVGGNKGVESEYNITGKSSILLISKPLEEE